MARGLSKDFLNAMREKLEIGERKGKVGWECHWNCRFPGDPIEFLLARLHQEVDELVTALARNRPEEIRLEAADVANFAMMIADFTSKS